jgi:hypothetical protein
MFPRNGMVTLPAIEWVRAMRDDSQDDVSFQIMVRKVGWFRGSYAGGLFGGRLVAAS